MRAAHKTYAGTLPPPRRWGASRASSCNGSVDTHATTTHPCSSSATTGWGRSSPSPPPPLVLQQRRAMHQHWHQHRHRHRHRHRRPHRHRRQHQRQHQHQLIPSDRPPPQPLRPHPRRLPALVPIKRLRAKLAGLSRTPSPAVLRGQGVGRLLGCLPHLRRLHRKETRLFAVQRSTPRRPKPLWTC